MDLSVGTRIHAVCPAVGTRTVLPDPGEHQSLEEPDSRSSNFARVLTFSVILLLAADVAAQEASLNVTSIEQVMVSVDTFRTELESLRFIVGRPENHQPEIELQGAAPREVYYVGRKFPAHVYQRAGILEAQLVELENLVRKNPDWMTGESTDK